ncbi:hypothetical protein [Nonomuraea fastidiosa]
MPTLEEALRQAMAEETAHLQAAPDLLERVIAGTGSRRRRLRAAAAALAMAAAAAVPAGYVAAGSLATPPDPVTVTPAPEPPPIDDLPQEPSDPPSLGDLGDGREFGHVKVGYLPKGLRWKHRSLDFGDRYTTSYDYNGDENGYYCVQLYVYENDAAADVTDRIQALRDEKDGEDVTVGGRAGYYVVQGAGEDGGDGTPTLLLQLAERQWVEISISPLLVKDLGSMAKVKAEMWKIAEGLSSTL